MNQECQDVGAIAVRRRGWLVFRYSYSYATCNGIAGFSLDPHSQALATLRLRLGTHGINCKRGGFQAWQNGESVGRMACTMVVELLTGHWPGCNAQTDGHLVTAIVPDPEVEPGVVATIKEAIAQAVAPGI